MDPLGAVAEAVAEPVVQIGAAPVAIPEVPAVPVNPAVVPVAPPVAVPQPVPMPQPVPVPQPVAPPIAQPPMPMAQAQPVQPVRAMMDYSESPYEPPMTAEEALATAEREGLIMPRSNSQTGYRGVTHVTGKKARPFQAWVCREGKLERLGRFATPEEAALCRARTPEGKKAASRSARGGKSSPAPMTVEEAEAQAEAAEAQAEAEGLTLQRSENQTGYVGVYVNTSNKVKPFEARVRRDGKRVSLGHFATAEEAALEVRRRHGRHRQSPLPTPPPAPTPARRAPPAPPARAPPPPGSRRWHAWRRTSPKARRSANRPRSARRPRWRCPWCRRR